ncbi:putative ATPase (plasmid) [Mycobacterium sp. JS623]|uniref:protein kinase domain-containing protein n=1 Tax=Mycobacterium sp. JS623 TaxID=212767 RepID=UPI0002A55D45|nr:protein kinase [Mycobacterium sp. JS623]AGB26736.1 putative ATPase [Mycobacterium sp. JS623]
MNSDPFETQRDVRPAVVTELRVVGFDDAEEIGRGGFGIVYRCTQVALDRTIAVKVLTAELDENRERFLREQRAMGRLTGHPNIVGVMQVGETEGGYPYLVMPYHRKGSLHERIKRLGVLPLDEVLRLGVKMAGALESAHRLGIVHRDVKPGNILLTDYGEPALSDFGIAHIAGGFRTATGTFTGSPAFTAPEILSGDPPSAASDVYGLAATLFAALTGHAAYERRSGEQVVAQFLRIASEPVPDLRESGISDDVSTLVEKAMARDPVERPSAHMLGEELRQLQARHELPVDDMALHAPPHSDQPGSRGPARRPAGSLPPNLTSFVGRRAELLEVERLLSTSRLVTLTGVGGVGKTRLAVRAAAEASADFPDARLVELGELRDASMLVEIVAADLGLRDESARSLRDVLVDFLCLRPRLLVLDNCEQMVNAAAELAESLLRECPELRILATSRERLGIDGESVLQLTPLTVPDTDDEPTLRGLAEYDAVALFTERAATAVPGFQLTENNKTTIARICTRLDGLALAIELAAARLRTMSPEQILERLADRYTLLTRGSRTAPTRQQTLSWSIDWSYELCTPAEQEMWARLSVFAGSFELEAAEDICGGDGPDVDVDDLLASLVDKSILIRTESNGQVRFRLLETLRDYAQEKLRQTGEYSEIRLRHLDWYRRLVNDAATDWFSVHQVDWIRRLRREGANLREAWEFSLTDAPEIALEIAAAFYPFGIARGALTETRRWLDRALAAAKAEPTTVRVKALYGAALAANLHGLPGDIQAGAALAADAERLVQHMSDPIAQGLTAVAVGYAALLSGEYQRARAHFEKAVAATDDPTARAAAMTLMGWALEFQGDVGRALVWQEKALTLTKSLGESVYSSWALWSVGIGWWRQGKPERAEQLLKESLQLTRLVDDPRHGAACLEALAWVTRAKDEPKRAVVLMAAADTLGGAQGASPVILPDLAVFHDECERQAREALGHKEFEAARRDGHSMQFDEAVAFALSG